MYLKNISLKYILELKYKLLALHIGNGTSFIFAQQLSNTAVIKIVGNATEQEEKTKS